MTSPKFSTSCRLRWFIWLLVLTLVLVFPAPLSRALPQQQQQLQLQPQPDATPATVTSNKNGRASPPTPPFVIDANSKVSTNPLELPHGNGDSLAGTGGSGQVPPAPQPSDQVQTAAAAASAKLATDANSSQSKPVIMDGDSNIQSADNALNGLQIGLIVAASVAMVGLVIGMTVLLRGIRRLRRRSTENAAMQEEAGKPGDGTGGGGDDTAGSTRAGRRSSASRDLRRSSAIFRAGQRSQRGSVNTFSEVAVEAVPRRTTQRGAIPAPLMLETGQASGVLADAEAFPPLPGPARMRDRHPAGRRAGIGAAAAAAGATGDTRRWTVSIDTGDLEVVPLPPPSYPEALRNPPAASD